MKTLISANELQLLLAGHSDVLVIDARFSLADKSAGRNAWQKSHIAGAYFLDLEADLSGIQVPGVTGRHPLPVKKEWLKTLGKIGLTPQTQVVAYDDAGGAGAARVWWMLRWAGHTRVAVLDGGWQAWLRAGGDVDADEAVMPQNTAYYEAGSSPVRLVTAEEIDSDSQVLIDARDYARFKGKAEPIDPVAGHIPGARCYPFQENLDEHGEFLSAAALDRRFSDIKRDADIVSYCGSGVTACHNILALVHAGYREPALYPGSWSEWITDPDHGIATHS